MSTSLKNLWLLVAKFFNNPVNFEILLSIKDRKAQTVENVKISLRMIEFTTTTYSVIHPVRFLLAKKDNFVSVLEENDQLKMDELNKDGWELDLFDLRREYEKQIRTYHKRMFDPCCRAKPEEKILFEGPNGLTIQTSLAQLVFFYWAISNGVVEWIMSHAKEIRREMRKEEEEKCIAKETCTTDYRPRMETLKRKYDKIVEDTEVQCVAKTIKHDW